MCFGFKLTILPVWALGWNFRCRWESADDVSCSWLVNGYWLRFKGTKEIINGFAAEFCGKNPGNERNPNVCTLEPLCIDPTRYHKPRHKLRRNFNSNRISSQEIFVRATKMSRNVFSDWQKNYFLSANGFPFSTATTRGKKSWLRNK